MFCFSKKTALINNLTEVRDIIRDEDVQKEVIKLLQDILGVIQKGKVQTKDIFDACDEADAINRAERTKNNRVSFQAGICPSCHGNNVVFHEGEYSDSSNYYCNDCGENLTDRKTRTKKD